MSIYEPPDITVDRDAIFENVVTQLQAEVPGLQIPAASPLWMILRAVCSMHADKLEAIYERAAGEFDAYGDKMIRLPRVLPTSATATATVTAIDDSGYSLPAGTGISVAASDGDRVAFSTVTDLVIAPGDTTGAVDVVAITPGEAGNGWLTDAQLDIPLVWVDDVTFDAASDNGTDGETDDEYRDRLSEYLQNFGTTLTTPRRFAIAAQIVAGVERALPLDLFKPGPPYDADPEDDDIDGHITVAIHDEDGAPVTSGIRNTVQAFLDENAISPLQVWVIDPTYTDIDVVFTAVADDDYDPATVEAAAEAAVIAFLDPARWGAPAILTGPMVQWTDQPIVRFQDVSAVLNTVEGLDYWTALTINGGTADVTLDGPAGLPSSASTAAGTVT